MTKCLTAWALGVFLATASVAFGNEIVVVVNHRAPVQQLTEQEIKDIYLGERSYWGKTKIHPMGYLSKYGVQTEFLRQVMDVSPSTYAKYWIKRIFREGGVPPVSSNGNQELLSAVANTQGAIGFLFSDQLPLNTAAVRIVYKTNR